MWVYAHRAVLSENPKVGLLFCIFLNEINRWECATHHYLLLCIVISSTALLATLAGTKITLKLHSMEQPFILLIESVGQGVRWPWWGWPVSGVWCLGPLLEDQLILAIVWWPQLLYQGQSLCVGYCGLPHSMVTSFRGLVFQEQESWVKAIIFSHVSDAESLVSILSHSICQGSCRILLDFKVWV